MHIEEETLHTNQQNEEENSLVEITSLDPKMQRFIHLYITGQYTLQDLAGLLEVHPNTLGNWLKREDVNAIIIDMQKTTHKLVSNQLKALTTKAAMKLSALLDSPIDGVALQAVKDVLDRGEHKPSQKIQVDKTVVTFEQKLNNLIEDVIDEGELIVEEVDDDDSLIIGEWEEEDDEVDIDE